MTMSSSVRRAPGLRMSWVAVAVAVLVSAAGAVERVPKPGKIVPPTKEWIAKVQALAPAKSTATPKAKRAVMVFSVATGYKHQVIPHAKEVIRVLGAKTGAFTPTFTSDIEMFTPEKLKGFDAVILNSTCSRNPLRNLFVDILSGKGVPKDQVERFKTLTPEQVKARADELEKSLLDYVASGKGLMGIHGSVVTFNNSDAFGEAIGAHFDYHPRAQELVLSPAEPGHPLLKAFGGEKFIHTDECYMMKGKAYAKTNFRPMLTLKTSEVQGIRKGKAADDIVYVSWIKKHGEGRVFYCSPSHFPDSYHSAVLLRYYLDGLQYALGDLECDDTPVKK